MRKPIFTRSRSLPYNETGWLCFKVHLGGGRRGGGGGGGNRELKKLKVARMCMKA